MKRIGPSLAGLVMVAGMMAIPCPAQNAQKIVDEYVRAIGGEKAVAAQRTQSISGSVRVKGTGDDEDSSESLGTYSLVVKAPNKFYSEFGVGAARDVVAFNGKSAWEKNGGAAAVTLTGPSAFEAEAEARYLNGRLVHLKRDKVGVHLVGNADVHSQTAYQVELAFSPEVKRELFFDTGTHLLVREIRPAIGAATGEGAASGTGSVQTDYFDYRAVKGVMEPQSMEVTRDGKTYTISVTHIDLNSDVSDAIFNFPSNDKRPLPDNLNPCTAASRNTGYNLTLVNGRCAKTIDGERCAGTHSSAVDDVDWQECSSCSQCGGIGWWFVRKPK